MSRFALACCTGLVGLLVGVAVPAVRAQVSTGLVSSDRVRFRLVGDEPIALADGRNFMNGWKVVVLRDTRSDQCFVTFVAGSAMSTTGPSVCP